MSRCCNGSTKQYSCRTVWLRHQSISLWYWHVSILSLSLSVPFSFAGSIFRRQQSQPKFFAQNLKKTKKLRKLRFSWQQLYCWHQSDWQVKYFLFALSVHPRASLSAALHLPRFCHAGVVLSRRFFGQHCAGLSFLDRRSAGRSGRWMAWHLSSGKLSKSQLVTTVLSRAGFNFIYGAETLKPLG